MVVPAAGDGKGRFDEGQAGQAESRKSCVYAPSLPRPGCAEVSLRRSQEGRAGPRPALPYGTLSRKRGRHGVSGRSQMQISSTGLAVSHVSFIAGLPSQLPALLMAPTQAVPKPAHI
jgi:hypothetical protein